MRQGPSPLSGLSTLGPCPTCGQERFLRRETEHRQGAISLRVVYYVDCGRCPTLRTELLPPGDELGAVSV